MILVGFLCWPTLVKSLKTVVRRVAAGQFWLWRVFYLGGGLPVAAQLRSTPDPCNEKVTKVHFKSAKLALGLFRSFYLKLAWTDIMLDEFSINTTLKIKKGNFSLLLSFALGDCGSLQQPTLITVRLCWLEEVWMCGLWSTTILEFNSIVVWCSLV